MVMQSCLTLT